jgi:UDP-2,4-diacetamido-2,4,6-trideoxy-beta-L-altropyranose hydrolase
MRLAFRVDASLEIGTGHLARCLSLGKALADLGWQVAYVVRRLDTVAERLVADLSGLTFFWLDSPSLAPIEYSHDAPTHHAWARVDAAKDALDTVATLRAFDPEWVIVDHYAFDARWHSLVADGLNCSVGAIDDLGDRSLSVSLLVDHNWESNHALKYAGCLTPGSEALYGPRYALLSTVFREARRYEFSEDVRSIGIFLGGTDAENYSLCALKACLELVQFTGAVELVIRSTHPHLESLVAYCAHRAQVKITLDQPDLTLFFASHDLQVGAGGGATWERCCIGVPSVLIAFAENQRRVVDYVAELGMAAKAEPPNMVGLAQAVRGLIQDVSARRHMAKNGPTLVDGMGCVRVALVLSREWVSLRGATQDDVDKAYRWRNAESTRRFFRDSRLVDWAVHVDWWEQTLVRTDSQLLIGAINVCEIGVVRLDQIQSEEVEVSLYLAPEYVGLGLGSTLLRATRSWVSSHLLNVRRIRADVDVENGNSGRAFSAAGYSRLSDRVWLIEV